MKKLLAFLLLLVSCGTAHAVPMCTITGQVLNSVGSPCINCTVFFDQVKDQVVNSAHIARGFTSVTTDSSGNLTAPITTVGLPQGVVVQTTVSGGASFTTYVPFASTVTFTSFSANTVQAAPTAGAGSFTNLTASGAISVTGTGTGGSDIINHVSLNNVINPQDYGVKGDARVVISLTTNGTNTITGPNATWTSADVGKDILVYDRQNGGGQNIFTGTISTVNGAGSSITVSGTTDQSISGSAAAVVCTDDTTAMQTAINSIGGILQNTSRSGIIQIPNVPLCVSNTLTIQAKSAEIAGFGIGSVTATPPVGTSIFWAGTSGIPMFQVQSSTGVRIHDLVLVGNSRAANRPSALIDTVQTGIGSVNSFNSFYNMLLGAPGSVLGMAEGAGEATTPSTVATECIQIDSTGAQNDRNVVSRIQCLDAGTGVLFGQNQAVEWQFEDFSCIDVGTCFNDQAGAPFTGRQIEELNTAEMVALGTGAHVTFLGVTTQNDSTFFNSTFGDKNLRYFTFKGTGGNPGGTMTCIDCGLSVSSAINAVDNKIVLSDPANTGDWRLVLEQPKFPNSVSNPYSGTFLIDLTFSGVSSRLLDISNAEGLGQANILVPSGNTDNRSTTRVRWSQSPGSAIQSQQGSWGGAQGETSFNVLVGGDTSLNMFRTDIQGGERVLGGPIQINQLSGPSTFQLTCTTAGAATYFYKITSCFGGTAACIAKTPGAFWESTAGNENSVASCANTVSGVNDIHFRVLPGVGADSYCIYRSDTGGPNGGGSGAEKLETCMAADSFATAVGIVNSFDDTTNSVTGVSPPTTNTTGSLVLSPMNVQLGTAVATPGAASTAVVGQTGGAGPATAGQNGWAKIILSDGTTGFLPVWK